MDAVGAQKSWRMLGPDLWDGGVADP